MMETTYTALFKDELDEKRLRVARLAKALGLDGVVLCTIPNISWYTGGAELAIDITDPYGPCALLLFEGQTYVLTTRNEEKRLYSEELSLHGYRFEVREWFESLEGQLRQLVGGLKIGTDHPSLAGTTYIGPRLAALRYTLTPAEIIRYREIGLRCGRTLEAVAAQAVTGITEREMAARLDGELKKEGLMPIVTLVASDERIVNFRHPIPTGQKIKRSLMLVTCARSKGLVVAATRMVHFGKVPAELKKRHRDVVTIEAHLIQACRPGTALGELFALAKRLYEEYGYKDEYQLHHQGGTIGYLSREYLALPGSREIIHAPQAVAFNPSITGTKSEDSFLITADGFECLTKSNNHWPVLQIEIAGQSIPRPDILEL